ncbi:hypothetical protein AB4K20DRAFT_1791063 [Rhizopus microsporus]|uniref:Uncharacterized protein n=1 Tax=Rhizopus microsporus TaxID=58291 RepID=A0A1X0RLW8_RHIZD|nr:hypothetical protein BCV71DRAFT_239579 [Rhizopus microsporus]
MQIQQWAVTIILHSQKDISLHLNKPTCQYSSDFCTNLAYAHPSKAGIPLFCSASLAMEHNQDVIRVTYSSLSRLACSLLIMHFLIIFSEIHAVIMLNKVVPLSTTSLYQKTHRLYVATNVVPSNALYVDKSKKDNNRKDHVQTLRCIVNIKKGSVK